MRSDAMDDEDDNNQSETIPSITMIEEENKMLEPEDESFSVSHDAVNEAEAMQLKRHPLNKLSKSWSIRSAHVPTYTGGKIEVFSARSHDETRSSLFNPSFLLTPVNGDLCFVNAQTGTPIGSIRRGVDSVSGLGIFQAKTGNEDGENDVDDGDLQDADFVTAFALSHSNTMIMTCTRNMILRQYFISDDIIEQTTDDNVDEKEDENEETSDNNASTKQQLHNLKIKRQKIWGKCGHTLPVSDIQFHMSDSFCATSSVDGSVRVWDVSGGFITHVYRPMSNTSGNDDTGGSGVRSVTCVRWYPHVEHLILAIGRDDGSICIHNLRTATLSSAIVLKDHDSSVTCIEWNVTHRLMVTAGRDQVLNVWKFDEIKDNTSKTSTKKQKTINSARKIIDQNVTNFQYKKLKTLPVYEQVEGLILLPELLNSDSTIGSNHESKQDNSSPSVFAVSAGSKGDLRMWRISDLGIIQVPMVQPMSASVGEKHGGYRYLRLIQPNDDHAADSGRRNMAFLAADSECNMLIASVVTKGALEWQLVVDRTIVGNNDEVLDLKIIPNGEKRCSKIVVVTNSSQVRIFDLDTFSCCAVLDKHTATCLCVDVSPCGNYVVTSGKDKTARVWYIAPTTNVSCTTTAICTAVAQGHTEAVGSVALSKKANMYQTSGKSAANGGGAFIVTASMDRTIKRWNLPGSDVLSPKLNNQEYLDSDTDSAFQLTTFVSTRAHEKDINIVSIAPNDSSVATGSQDKTIKLWKAYDLSLVAVLKGHRRGVWDCQFSLTDRVLASASADKTVKLWSIASGDYSCVRTFQGHVASVLRVRFLGGLQLLSSGSDGLVKLWTIRTNECEATMDAHYGKVWAMDNASEFKTIVSGCSDSHIIVWQDTTAEIEEAKQAEQEEIALLDQELTNHLRRKEYGQALEISLERDKPHHALKILNAIVESAATSVKKQPSDLSFFLLEIQKHSYLWKSSKDRLIRLLHYCRDWNTKARNCYIALLTLKAIVTSMPAQTLATTEGVAEILAGIIPYAERHFDRLDRLNESSFLVDFALSSMGVMSAEETDIEYDYEAWAKSRSYVLPPPKSDEQSHFVKNNLDNYGDDVQIVGDSDSETDL